MQGTFLHGVIFESSIWAFLVFTVLIGGGAAFQTGRAIAQTWQSIWQLVPYAILLAFTVRFLYFAVLEQTLMSLHYYLVDFVVLLLAAMIGWRMKRASQMASQYRWLYESSGPFAWRKKS